MHAMLLCARPGNPPRPRRCPVTRLRAKGQRGVSGRDTSHRPKSKQPSSTTHVGRTRAAPTPSVIVTFYYPLALPTGAWTDLSSTANLCFCLLVATGHQCVITVASSLFLPRPLCSSVSLSVSLSLSPPPPPYKTRHHEVPHPPHSPRRRRRLGPGPGLSGRLHRHPLPE